MKTAIYIEDGIVQLVITPESEFEKNAISTFRKKPLDVHLFDGSFYDCRGGWIRQNEHYSNNPYNMDRDRDESLILTIRQSKEKEKK